MDNKSLGAFIAELRKEKGLTQRELAEYLCVSDKTVSHWERGENSPDLSLISLIADYFSVSCDELLRGCRKVSSVGKKEESMYVDEKENQKAHLYITDTLFKKFVSKNYIITALSVIAFLCGLIADYFLVNTVSFIIFTAILVVPVFLAVFFRNNFSINLASPYTDKNFADEYLCKANRTTANNLYFSFGCFVFFGIRTLSFFIPEILVLFLIFILSAGMIVFSEVLLRKKGLVKKQGKPLEIRTVTILRIVCLLAFCIFFYAGIVSHENINRMNFDYEYAEQTVISDKKEFLNYIGTYDGEPENYYYDNGLTYSADDKGEVFTIEDDNGTHIIFTYNNLKVADIQFHGGNFVIFTHDALNKGAEESEKYIQKMNIVHIAYYLLLTLVSFLIYKIIKRKFFNLDKNKKITLIKDF